MARRNRAQQPLPFQKRIVAAVEDGLALRDFGFGAASFECDRAELVVRWSRGDLKLTLSFYGLERIERLGMAVVPPDRSHAFALHQAVEVLDPALHARYPGPADLDAESLSAWVTAHAELLRDHGEKIFGRPEEVFEAVKAVAPLGPQLEQLVEMCRGELGLEQEHGFGAPRTEYWGFRCEITFVRDSVRVVVRLEDHENAGVTAEPFTVPELFIASGTASEISLTELAARLAPEHAATRPRSDRYAMALSAVRPWLAHDAAFLRAHPEVLQPA